MVMKFLAAAGAGLLLTACGDGAPEPPPVVESLTVTIDAGNNCSLENRPVECARVASVIQSRYPTSRPRVDICLAKETRFEAATASFEDLFPFFLLPGVALVALDALLRAWVMRRFP